LLVNTISDQIRLSNNFKSKLISVLLKDRGAVLPGGHTANGAYWHDWTTSSGYFVPSSYYMDELPEWVEDFNKQELSKNTWIRYGRHFILLIPILQALKTITNMRELYGVRQIPYFLMTSGRCRKFTVS
jgi:hypothetical protein